MRFRLGKKIYTFTSLGEPSIMDYLLLTMETEALGRPWTAGSAEALSAEIASCETNEQRSAHPDMMWLLALVVWSTKCVERRRIEPGLRPARVPFGDLIDVSLDDLEFLDDPQDHQEPAGPTKARAGSARAAKRPAAAKRAAAKKTSKKRSTTGS